MYLRECTNPFKLNKNIFFLQLLTLNIEQKKTLRQKCRLMIEKYRVYNFIVNDESNFTL